MQAGGDGPAFPVRGLVFGLAGAFGQPADAPSRCHLLVDAATNRLGVEVCPETGIHV